VASPTITGTPSRRAVATNALSAERSMPTTLSPKRSNSSMQRKPTLPTPQTRTWPPSGIRRTSRAPPSWARTRELVRMAVDAAEGGGDGVAGQHGRDRRRERPPRQPQDADKDLLPATLRQFPPAHVGPGRHQADGAIEGVGNRLVVDAVVEHQRAEKNHGKQ